MNIEKSSTAQPAAQRQIELLATALEQSKETDGLWLNPAGKTMPRFYSKGPTVSPFNSIILALHSDKGGYRSNDYTLFDEARKRGDSVLASEKGVPFNWYNWSKYVNKHMPTDVITRQQYIQLSPEEKENYKGIKNRETRILFNLDQTTMPYTSAAEYNRNLLYHGTANDRGNKVAEERQTRRYVNQIIALCKKNLVPIRKDFSGMAHYDSAKDAVYIPEQKAFGNYRDYVHELLRQIVTATGHQQRLAREGMAMKGAVVPSLDAGKQERLITELASGALCLELGIPAKVSYDSLPMVDYWTRELKENPILLDIVEAEVNNAVSTVHRAVQDLPVEKNAQVLRQQIDTLSDKTPKHYYIAGEIKTLPDKDTKQFVVVRDKAASVADVILPAGASTQVDNEIPGMNKNRITRALKEEGFSQVRFFNPDGALGYNPDDATFKGKEVSVGKMSGWVLENKFRLDISDAVNRAHEIDFSKVFMVQDDKARWALFIKPENEEAFSVYPERSEINQYFTTRNQGVAASFEQLKQQLATKYYMMVQTEPSLKVNIFKADDTQVDVSKIERVNIFKTKNPEDEQATKILCLPTIKGMEGVKPREISQQQWHRMWIAPDRDEYKKNLAATLFADLLRKDQAQEVKETAPAKQKPQGAKAEEKPVQEAQPANRFPHEYYNKVHAKHPDALLLFRVGGFYEAYKEDARHLSEAVGVTVRKSESFRDENGKVIAMAGFPEVALDTYLPKLVRAGHRCAICDNAPTLAQNVQQEGQARQAEAPNEEAEVQQSRGFGR